MKTLFLGLVSFVLCGTDSKSTIDFQQQQFVYDVLKYNTSVHVVNKPISENITINEILLFKLKGDVKNIIFPARHEVMFIKDTNNKQWCLLPFTESVVEEYECYKFIGNYVIGSTKFLKDSVNPIAINVNLKYNSNVGFITGWEMGVDKD